MNQTLLKVHKTWKQIMMSFKLTKMRLELQGQNCVDVNYRKTSGLGACLASKSTLEEHYFIDSEPNGEVISSQIGIWLSFILQNSNGCGGLNFWAKHFEFCKSTYLLKLVKWFYYTKSKSLLVSDVRKMETSLFSINRDLHALTYPRNNTIGSQWHPY